VPESTDRRLAQRCGWALDRDSELSRETRECRTRRLQHTHKHRHYNHVPIPEIIFVQSFFFLKFYLRTIEPLRQTGLIYQTTLGKLTGLAKLNGATHFSSL